MESILTLSDAKARFSEIVEKATNGDVFVVTRMGKPVVRITRFVAHGQPRKLGDFAGRIRMSEDFDEWPQDLQEALGMAEPSAGAARKRAEREERARRKRAPRKKENR